MSFAPCLLLASLLLPSAGPAPATPPAAQAAATAPTVPEGFVLHPFFTTATKSYSAGTAFVVDVKGQPLVVTAYDLLGPNGGLAAQIDAKAVPTEVKSVDVKDAYNGRSAGKTTGALLIAEAHVMKDDAAGDVAAFKIERPSMMSIPGGTTTPIIPGRLATATPKKGDHVWLAAALVTKGVTARAFSATIVQSDDKWLFYKFDDPAVDLAGTPGAPLLDAAGDVVGMQLGGGKTDEGLIGAACPLSALTARLESGLMATP